MIAAELLMAGKPVSEDEIDEVALVLDAAGIDELCQMMQRLRNSAAPDHLHLVIGEWGDGELTPRTPENNYTTVSHLRIVRIEPNETI